MTQVSTPGVSLGVLYSVPASAFGKIISSVEDEANDASSSARAA